MRLLPLLAGLAMTACTAQAQDPTGVAWTLRALDGQAVDIPATLTIGAAGEVSGKAPCNSYGGMNLGVLPEMKLSPLRVTRMACDRLRDEDTFFDALTAMTLIERRDERTLVLSGPGGRSMEFTLAP